MNLIGLVFLWMILTIPVFILAYLLHVAGLISESWSNLIAENAMIIAAIYGIVLFVLYKWRKNVRSRRQRCYGQRLIQHHFTASQSYNRCLYCGATKEKAAREIEKLKKKGETHYHEIKGYKSSFGSSERYCVTCGATESEIAKQKEENGKETNLKKETVERPQIKAFFTAVATRDVEQMKALLKKDSGLVNARDKWSFMPLQYAALRGHAEVVKLLLAEGAQVNARDNQGHTALEYAEKKGHAKVAELLRKHKERG